MRAVWISIAAATVLVVGAIMETGHWQLAVASYGYVGPDGVEQQRTEIYRLDRWTGDVQYCVSGPSQDGTHVAVRCQASTNP